MIYKKKIRGCSLKYLLGLFSLTFLIKTSLSGQKQASRHFSSHYLSRTYQIICHFFFKFDRNSLKSQFWNVFEILEMTKKIFIQKLRNAELADSRVENEILYSIVCYSVTLKKWLHSYSSSQILYPTCNFFCRLSFAFHFFI